MAGHHYNGLIYFFLSNLFLLPSCLWIPSLESADAVFHEGTSQQEVEVSQSPSQIYALPNNPLTIPCGINANIPILDFWWLKNGVRLQNVSGMKYSDLNLSFDRVAETPDNSDEGRYRCVVKVQPGIILGPITYLSVVALEVETESSSVDSLLRQNVVLPCGVRSIPPGNITWTKIGSTLNSRYKLLDSGNLLISNIQENDGGTFQCTVTNYLLNSRKQSSVNLQINRNSSLFEPQILDTFNSHLKLTKDSSHLICVANGNPTPSVKWVLSFEMDNEVQSHVLSLDSKISLSQLNETGNYSCVASVNGVQQVSKSLYAYHTPSFSSLPPLQSFPAAKTVRFECKSPAFPTLWYKDGQLLQPNKGRIKQKNNELVISNTILSDSGFYQCESGDYIATGRLTVTSTREQLEAPVQLSCTSESSRTVHVRWKLMSGGNVQAFTVHYMPIEGGEERQQVTNNTTTSLLIESLLPNTNYSLYVRSYSGRSASGQSEKVFCSTLEDYPSSAPTLFTFDQLGPPTQYRLSWVGLTNEEARGKIILYKLQWRIEDGSFTNVQLLHGDSTEFIITGLQPSSNYLVRLLPATSIGYPPRRNEFAWTNIQTGPATSSLFNPPEVQISFLNSSAIGVTWDSPPGPTLSGFRIFLGEENERLGEIIYHALLELDSSRTSYVFTELAPSTQYEINIQSFNDNWESQLSVKYVRTTNGHVPMNETNFSTITGLEAIPRSPTEIELKWIKPSQINIDNYVIRYNAVDSNESSLVQSETESVLIGDLSPYTIYQFVIGYHVHGVSSPFSQKVETMTMEGLPGPPVSPQFEVLNKTSIKISWSRPARPNGLITGYFVEFTNSSEAPSIIYTNESHLIILNLQANKVYSVRIAAETKAGVGAYSASLSPKIFSNAPDKSETGGMVQDGPSNNSSSAFFSGTSQQQLGLIFGTSLGLISIIICTIIIVWRNRCFSCLLHRNRRATFVNGRAEGKDMVDSAPVEMKVLNATHDSTTPLDTKGGHPNGIIHEEASEPLLVRVSRTPVISERSDTGENP